MNCPRCKSTYEDNLEKCSHCGSLSPNSFPGVKHIFTKVAGVSHKNKDRRSRQAIIKRLEKEFVGDRLFTITFGPGTPQFLLEDEPDNPMDPNAIKVLTEQKEQIGYLNKELAADIKMRSAAGYRYMALLAAFTGQDEDTRGVNMLIIEAAPDAPDSAGGRYFEEYFKPREAQKTRANIERSIPQQATIIDKQHIPSKQDGKYHAIIAIAAILIIILISYLSCRS